MKLILQWTVPTLLILLSGGCASTRVEPPVDRPAAASLMSRSAYPEIKREIDRLLPDSLFPPANAGISIVSVSSGEPLYTFNPDLLFNPASNQKLLTGVAALSCLGPAYRFETVAHIDSLGEPCLTITGAGDPLLTTADIDTIARMLAPFLSHRRAWTLSGDVSVFDDEFWGKGWMWDDEPDPTAMEVSPLSVDRNCIAVQVRAGRAAGEPLLVTTDPATAFVSLVNAGITASDSIRFPLEVTRRRRVDSNIIEISGELRPGDTVVTRRVSVRDPARYFLTLLAERLRAQGLPVAGIRTDTVRSVGNGIVVRSRGLDSVLTFMIRVSDNLSAECLLKILGREGIQGRGSSEAGIRMVRKILGGLGVDTATVVSADGSGISRYNLVSARALSTLLVRSARDSALFPLLWHSLPIAGRSGTLQRRMLGTAAEGAVRAKTGTMTGASALSGYARSADGEPVAFAILMQHYAGDAGRYRAVQDSVAAALPRLKR